MKSSSCFVLVAALALAPAAFSQGELTPPGAPAPSMKRLDELEPRTNLQATPAPPGVETSSGDFHFIINQPGSYYLSGNLVATKPAAIYIQTEGVTLDLNGFEISAPGNTGAIGIGLAATASRTTIRNGSVKGFNTGIRAYATLNSPARACTFQDLVVSHTTEVALYAGNAAIVERCRFTSCTSTALLAGEGSTLTDCVASGNSVNEAIATGVGSTVTNCSATRNTAAFGVSVGAGSTIVNSTATANVSSFATSGGFRVGSGSTVTGCSALQNTTSLGTATASTGVGFLLDAGSTIQNSTASANKGDGIRLTDKTAAVANTCYNNGGGGIHTSGGDNRIEGNTVTMNARGLHIEGTNNNVRENTVRTNSDNYAIVAGNQLELLLSQIPQVIAWPAKVKLAGTLTAPASTTGILIAADDVTVDLNGHALVGVASSHDAIALSGTRRNIKVLNGSVRSWGQDGVDLGQADVSTVADVQVHGCGAAGVTTGPRGNLTKVTSTENGGPGIITGVLNRVVECTVFGNTGDGIIVGDASTVERCIANFGKGDGIVANGNCVLRENTCDFVNSPGKAGIRVPGSRTRLEANQVTRSTIGFSVTGANNLIIRNSASGNTTNFAIAAGNSAAPAVTNTTIAGSSNPHANYEN